MADKANRQAETTHASSSSALLTRDALRPQKPQGPPRLTLMENIRQRGAASASTTHVEATRRRAENRKTALIESMARCPSSPSKCFLSPRPTLQKEPPAISREFLADGCLEALFDGREKQLLLLRRRAATSTCTSPEPQGPCAESHVRTRHQNLLSLGYD